MKWIDVNKPWHEFTHRNAGVQIEVRHRAAYARDTFLPETVFHLIGDLNELGGVCDDCQGIRRDDLVLRMRVLVPKAQLDGVE